MANAKGNIKTDLDVALGIVQHHASSKCESAMVQLDALLFTQERHISRDALLCTQERRISRAFGSPHLHVGLVTALLNETTLEVVQIHDRTRWNNHAFESGVAMPIRWQLYVIARRPLYDFQGKPVKGSEIGSGGASLKHVLRDAPPRNSAVDLVLMLSHVSSVHNLGK